MKSGLGLGKGEAYSRGDGVSHAGKERGAQSCREGPALIGNGNAMLKTEEDRRRRR